MQIKIIFHALANLLVFIRLWTLSALIISRAEFIYDPIYHAYRHYIRQS